MVKRIIVLLFVFLLFSTVAAETNETDFLTSNESDFEMNLISRGRVELMRAFHKRDSAEVMLNITRLDSMNYGSVNSISKNEKEIVLLEMEMWRDLLQYEVAYYKNLYKSLSLKKQSKIDDDELAVFANKQISKLEGPLYNRYSDKIVNSELSDSEKDELEIVLLLRDAFGSYDVKNLLAQRSRSFAAKYFSHPDVEWIEKCIGVPYSNIYVEELYTQDKSNRKERIIEDKLYTGGFGINAFLYSGGFGPGLNNLYNENLFEPEYNYINLELYLQVNKLSFSVELMTTAKHDVQVYSLGVGMVFYDSRFLKVRPYLAIGLPSVVLEAKQSLKDDEGNTYMWKGSNDQYYGNVVLTVAANFDFKFITARFFNSENTLFSMSLVGKFGASRIKFDESNVKGSGANLFFDFGIGMYFW